MDEDNYRPSFGMGSTGSFAESQMAKYGWKKGSGLGSRGDGINRAISVGFKNDTNGLGAKADEWSFQWWDHVFNKASSGIQVSAGDDGVEVKAKPKAEKEKAKKALLYGAFVKAAPEEEEDDEEKDYIIKVTDEELLQACEGRTARKGARAYQPGKLKRAGMEKLVGEESDHERATSFGVDIAGSNSTEKKKKRADREEKGETKKKSSRKERTGDNSETLDAADSKSKSKKSKKDKTKKKRQSGDGSIETPPVTPPDTESDMGSAEDADIPRAKANGMKKSKRHEKKPESDVSSSKEKKKRKKDDKEGKVDSKEKKRKRASEEDIGVKDKKSKKSKVRS
ncbi:G patch domain-containing protein 4 [Gaertneriomyces sp. JEL0708]|nr:G patch domain-containing protein 4 [Gaertneriomyces sp. JEL0708]